MSSRFHMAVRKAFSFLELKYDFHYIESGQATVIYNNNNVDVAIFYDDQRSFEVSLSLHNSGNPEQPPYNFDELLRVLNVPNALWPFGYSVVAWTDVEQLILKMASITNLYVANALMINDSLWKDLAENRRNESIICAKNTTLDNARIRAGEAWKRKDYKQVIESLDNVKYSLGAADLAKLNYSRRMMSS